MEQVGQNPQSSIADIGMKFVQEEHGIPSIKLLGPLSQKDQSGGHTKRSAIESCSSSQSQEEECQADDKQSNIRQTVERERELHSRIRQEAARHGCSDIFQAFDGLTEEFRKIERGSTLLTERVTAEELFARLCGELKAALFDLLHNERQQSESSSSSFLGGAEHDMMIQLRTIQQLRERIDYLEGQLLEQPVIEIVEPKQREDQALRCLQSVKQSLMVESPQQNTFDKNNCNSLAEYGSSAFNYYAPPYQPIAVERWDHCTNIVRQFSIAVVPAQSEPLLLVVPESTKRAFRSITTTYKRLFRRYLESLTTSWKLLLKLLSTIKKTTHEKFVASGRALLHLIKEQLNRVTIWYGNLKLPVMDYTCHELDQFMGICDSGLAELHDSKEQIDCLLMELAQR